MRLGRLLALLQNGEVLQELRQLHLGFEHIHLSAFANAELGIGNFKELLEQRGPLMMDLDGLVCIEQFVVGQLHSAGDFALLGGQAMSGLLSSRSGHVLLTGQGPREGEPLRQPIDGSLGPG